MGIVAVPVRKIEQRSGPGQLPPGAHGFDFPEHRREICAAPALDFYISSIGKPPLPVCNDCLVLQAAVALEENHLHLPKEVLLGAEDTINLLQKAANQGRIAGGRGVNGDGKGIQAANLFVFQRLQQGHIAIALHSQSVKPVVKAVLIGFQLLPWHGKPAQIPSEVKKRVLQIS